MLLPTAVHAGSAHRVDIPAGPLADALERLAASDNRELIYQRSDVAGVTVPAVHSTRDADEILKLLLSGTNLVATRTREGTIIIKRLGAQAQPDAAADPEAANLAVPEILVVGHRTQNTDIRRRSDDIEPYVVIGGNGDLQKSQTQFVDQYLTDFLASNRQVGSTLQAPKATYGEAVSSVDLRGFGSADTLMLIDGRRLPRNTNANAFQQSNILGLPIEAVDRIEVLASTAGGIFGPGATGGAVNIILRRPYHGLDVSLTSGISDQGDAPYWRISASGGLTSKDERTRASFTLSYARTRGLDFDSRSYPLDAENRRVSAAPENYSPPISPSFNFLAADYSPDFVTHVDLTLKPQYGGASLGADRSYLSMQAAGTAQATADLVSHAGSWDTRLSNDADGGRQSLTSGVRTFGGTFSLRHEISDKAELFFDALGWRTIGSADIPYATNSAIYLSADDPRNPFAQNVYFTGPLTDLVQTVRSHMSTMRGTLGGIFRLPSDWSAEVDLTLARSVLKTGRVTPYTYASYTKLDPLAGAAAYEAQLKTIEKDPLGQQSSRDNMLDGSIRLAGPLFDTPGGATTLTLLGEVRHEGTGGQHILQNQFDTPTFTSFRYQPIREQVYSLYSELRAPLMARDSRLWPVRGFELQLALRQDWIRSQTATLNGPVSAVSTDTPIGQALTTRVSSTSYTLGARSRPVPWLMLRGSFATGVVAPDADTVIENASFDMLLQSLRKGNDPLRGNTAVAPGTPVFVYPGKVVPPRTSSLSVGFVLTPDPVHDVRISVDFSRLRKSRLPFQFNNGDLTYVLAHPSKYPGAITRAALTAEDIALGYTGGEIESISLNLPNLMSYTAKAIDIAAEATFATHVGNFRLHAATTWEPSYTLHEYPGGPAFNLASSATGPIKLKGNVGLDWTKGRSWFQLSYQFTGPYRITTVDTGDNISTAIVNQALVQQFGSDTIPFQGYLDVMIGRAVRLDRTTIDLRLGVRNILGADAPLYTGKIFSGDLVPTTGYSLVADPRGRRVEFGAVAHF